jgi:hypothetical protein
LELVVTNRVARPSVRVVDDEGRPVTDYGLSVLPADPTRWNGLNAIVPGDYLLAALSTDEYNLLVFDPARFTDSRRKRIDDLVAASTRVTFVEGDDRTINLRMTALRQRQQ